MSGSTDGGVDSDNRETEDDGGLVAETDEGSGVDVAEETIEEEEATPARSTRSRVKARSKQ